MKKLWLSSMVLLMCMGVTACINKTNQADGKEVTLVLDYVPNTNHTGLYIAQEKGYFEEEGLKVTIIEPGDNNTSATLVATNKGQFGISYQEDVTAALSAKDPLPIKAIATIMQHNTSGFAVLKDSGMTSPKDFEGKVYAGWQSPSEEAVIKAVMHAYDADFSKLTMVGSDGSGFASMGKTVDILWVFEGWDLVKATMSGVETTYMPLKDLDARLDYYTPVVITNQEMLTNDPETIKRFMKAIKKGYEEAIANPKEAASILHTYAPEYELEYLEKSQEFVSSQYAMDSEQWGWMRDSVWDNYTDFMYENGLIDKKITASEQYTNEFLK